MKYLKTYNNYITEALSLKKAKKFTKLFNRERYEELFQKLKEKYDGDRNAYRIYIPLITEKRKNPTEDEIKAYLAEKGYEILDYFKGICKFKDAKNPSKIGQVLTKLKDNDKMKKFVEDPERKKGDAEELMVVVSRHPYDIAGSDTDRDWTNCMTMALTKKSPRIKAMIKRKKELEKELNKVGSIVNVNKLTAQINQLEADIEDYTQEGENARFLEHEVREGSLISYLIKKTDKNINNPLAVLNIKPYHGKDGIYLKACQNSYGIRNEDFHKTIEAFLEEINEGKSGSYQLNSKVYSDGDIGRIFTGERTLKIAMKEEGYIKDDDEENDDDEEEYYYGDDQDVVDTDGDYWFEDMYITSLEGIEKLKKAEQLHLDRNKLKNLNGIEALKKLTILQVSDNQLENVENIYSLKHLEELNCANNKITSLNLENFKKLTLLDIMNNKLTTLNVSELKNLDGLYCEENKLTEIVGLEKLKNLTNLYCSKNELTTLNVGKLEKLTDLDVANNKLTLIKGVEKLDNLNNFHYENNPLKWPLNANIVQGFGEYYTKESRDYFNTYEFQKSFIEKYKEKNSFQEKLEDLFAINNFNFDKQIQTEYKELLTKAGALDDEGKEGKKPKVNKTKKSIDDLQNIINNAREDYAQDDYDEDDWLNDGAVIDAMDKLEEMGYYYDIDNWEVYEQEQ